VDEKLLRRMVSGPDNYIFIGNWEGPEQIVGTFSRIIGLYILDQPSEEGS